MNTKLIATTALLIAAGFANAQGLSNLTRTEVVRHDHNVPGTTEAIQVRVDFPAGATAAAHSHPGVEIAYVLEGTFEYTLEGSAPVVLKTGESVYIPEGVNHSVRVLNNGKASELATYIVRKGEPVVKLAK
jgi:quercetin dioxygenase-like cupin family protein